MFSFFSESAEVHAARYHAERSGLMHSGQGPSSLGLNKKRPISAGSSTEDGNFLQYFLTFFSDKSLSISRPSCF